MILNAYVGRSMKVVALNFYAGNGFKRPCDKVALKAYGSKHL